MLLIIYFCKKKFNNLYKINKFTSDYINLFNNNDKIYQNKINKAPKMHLVYVARFRSKEHESNVCFGVSSPIFRSLLPPVVKAH